MTKAERDRRALIVLGAALVVILVVRAFTGGSETAVPLSAPVDSIPRAEKRLERVRQMAATVPGKETVRKQVMAELAGREKGIINADTAAQAQAQLLQIIRRLGKENGFDVRGGEFGPVRPLGEDYGEASVAVSFECQIERVVNFLAALSAQPETLASSEIRVTSANAKEKTVGVRLGISGVVPRKLVPARKGLGLF